MFSSITYKSKFGLEAELLDTKRLVERQSKKLEDVQKRNMELQQKLSAAFKPQAIEIHERAARGASSYIIFDTKAEGREQRPPFDDVYTRKVIKKAQIEMIK